jgi:hypothetical protein
MGDSALEFRVNHLLDKAFTAWQSGMEKKPATLDQQRSRLYTVFSSWKFYTKERVLLKKYLFECGESIGDMSMMTTVEMRDNAKKVGYDPDEVPSLNITDYGRNHLS